MRILGWNVDSHAVLRRAVLGCALVLTACATHLPPQLSAAVEANVKADEADAAALASSPWAVTSAVAPSPVVRLPGWQHREFPGKQASHYQYARLDGRDAMGVHAVSSASMLRQAVRVEPADLNRLKFSWKVPELMEAADIAQRDLDDSPVRIVLAFEGDRSKFSIKNTMLSELAHALTGEPLPYATLMYVWCNRRTPGSVVINPRTDRIRKLVMESGPKHLGQWLDYERDIRADFEKAFGEPPGALVAIGIMTDTDNTQSTAQAWYGPVKLVPITQIAAALPKN
jgi:hypothetical protein